MYWQCPAATNQHLAHVMTATSHDVSISTWLVLRPNLLKQQHMNLIRMNLLQKIYPETSSNVVHHTLSPSNKKELVVRNTLCLTQTSLQLEKQLRHSEEIILNHHFKLFFLIKAF